MCSVYVYYMATGVCVWYVCVFGVYIWCFCVYGMCVLCVYIVFVYAVCMWCFCVYGMCYPTAFCRKDLSALGLRALLGSISYVCQGTANCRCLYLSGTIQKYRQCPHALVLVLLGSLPAVHSVYLY